METSSLERRISDLMDISIGTSRAIRAMRADKPATTIIRGITAMFLAHVRGGDIARAIEQHYPSERQKIVSAMADPLGFLASKAVTSPAMTTVDGWASQLAVTGSAGVFAALSPASIYSLLAARSLRLDLAGFGSLSLPRRAAPPVPYNVFVGEGAPVPVRSFSLSGVPIATKKAGIISHFSGELAKKSTPAIETVLRQTLAEDIGLGVDSVLLSASAASSAAPAGLLFGIAPLTASTGTGAAAISADIGALLSAIAPSLDPVLIMGTVEQAALAQLPGALSLPVFVTNVLPAGTIIAVDAADFATATGDDVQIDITDDATIHSDTAPLPIVDGGGTAATPVTSLWQQNLFGLRCLEFLGWTLRSGKAAWTESVTW